MWTTHYAGSVCRLNGVVGEIAYEGDSVYVCVRGCDGIALPNTHPDYRPRTATVWVRVPPPDRLDWRYIERRYHTRDGWRID